MPRNKKLATHDAEVACTKLGEGQEPRLVAKGLRVSLVTLWRALSACGCENVKRRDRKRDKAEDYYIYEEYLKQVRPVILCDKYGITQSKLWRIIKEQELLCNGTTSKKRPGPRSAATAGGRGERERHMKVPPDLPPSS